MFEIGLLPTVLVANSRTAYDVPLTKPVSVNDVAAAARVVVTVAPTVGIAVTVKPVTAGAATASVNVPASVPLPGVSGELSTGAAGTAPNEYAKAGALVMVSGACQNLVVALLSVQAKPML